MLDQISDAVAQAEKLAQPLENAAAQSSEQPSVVNSGHAPIRQTFSQQATVLPGQISPFFTPPAARRTALVEPKMNLRNEEAFDLWAADPESLDCTLEIQRAWPVIYQGKNVPLGVMETLPTVVEVHSLRDIILSTWGGGLYKIVPKNQQGEMPKGAKTFTLEFKGIAPFFERGGPRATGNNSITLAPPPERDEDEWDEKKEKLELRRLEIQARKAEASSKAQLADMQAKAEIRRMQKTLQQELDPAPVQKPDNSSNETMKMMMEMQRDSQRMMMDVMKSVGETMAKAVEGIKETVRQQPVAPAPAPVDTMGPMVAMVGNFTNAMATMNAGKKEGPSEALELAKMQTASAERVAAMTVKATERQGAGENSMTRLLLDSLIQVRNKENPDGLKQVKEAMSLFRSFQDISGGGVAEAVEGGARSGWRETFDSLKEVAAIAMNSPVVMQMAQTLLGRPASNGEFTEAQIAGATQRIQTGPALPPPMPQAQLPHPMQHNSQQMQPQRQFNMPPAVQVPQRQQPIYAQAPAMPPQTMTPGAPIHIPDVQVPAAQPMDIQAMANEMESLSGSPPSASAQPVAPPAAPQAAPASETSETATERLRSYVDQAMGMAVEDLEDGRENHVWPEHAKAMWNADFKTAFINAADDQVRAEMIRDNCDPVIWDRVYAHTTTNSDKQVYFYNAIRALVEMIRG